MVGLVIRLVVNAVALWAAAKFVPNISFPAAEKFPTSNVDLLVPLVVVALVFGLVNSYIKPIVKTLSMPLSMFTIGIIGFLINVAMLLLTAFLADALKITFKLADFPPKFSFETLVAAVLGALVISIVSTALTLATAPIRRGPF
jgi:putative membrane protein